MCGGLNTNVLRLLTNRLREVQQAGGSVQAPAAVAWTQTLLVDTQALVTT